MSVIFAAIVPHNPIFLPAIGKENTALVQTSLDAVAKIRHFITEQNIDTLIIFSSHSPRLKNTFAINQCAKYIGTFEQFGDLVTSVSSRGDIELSHRIKEYIEPKVPIQTFCKPDIDYGIAVPLSLLQTDTKPFKIIPISMTNKNADEHISIGRHILEQADISPKRIGVITSMHLSHIDNKRSTSRSKKCDDAILQAIRNKDLESLKGISSDTLKESRVYGIEGLFMLLGMINDKKYSVEVLAFQNILDTSHLTAIFTW